MNAQLKDGRIVRENMPTPAPPDEGMPPAAACHPPRDLVALVPAGWQRGNLWAGFPAGRIRDLAVVGVRRT